MDGYLRIIYAKSLCHIFKSTHGVSPVITFFFCLVCSCTDIEMTLCWSLKRSTFAIINIVLFFISCMHWCNHARRVDCCISFGSLTTTMLIETQCSVLVIICNS